MLASRRPYVVILGQVGHGKTTLAQKLARKDGLGVRDFGDSATRASTVYRTEHFSFADTPGYRVLDEKLDHATAVIRALEVLPVSRIVVVSKYDTRIDVIVRAVIGIVTPLLEHLHAVTVIVTSWDLSDGSDQTKQAIRDAMKQNLDVESVFFSGLNTTKEELLENVKSSLLPNPIKIDIPADQIPRYFDVKRKEVRILASIRDFTEDFKAIAANIMQQVRQFEDEDERGDLAFYGLAVLKELVNETIANLTKEHNLLTEEEDYLKNEDYAFLSQLRDDLTIHLKEYREFCRNYDIFSDGDNTLFRKCNHCGEVWTLEEIGNGETICEEKLSKQHYNFEESGEKFVFSWRLDRNNPRQIIFEQTPLQDTWVDYGVSFFYGKVVGCRRKIDWSTMKAAAIPAGWSPTASVKRNVPMNAPVETRPYTKNSRSPQEDEMWASGPESWVKTSITALTISAASGPGGGTGGARTTHQAEQPAPNFESEVRKDTEPNAIKGNYNVPSLSKPENPEFVPSVLCGNTGQMDIDSCANVRENATVASARGDFDVTMATQSDQHSRAAKPYVAFLGAAGQGKPTNLLQLLFGKNEKERFCITEVSEMNERFWHVFNTVEELENLHVSRIFVVSKHDSRVDNMINSVKEIVKSLKVELLDAVSVIVTSSAKKNAISTKFKDELGVKSVLFTNLDSLQNRREELLRNMTASLLPKPIKIELQNRVEMVANQMALGIFGKLSDSTKPKHHSAALAKAKKEAKINFYE